MGISLGAITPISIDNSSQGGHSSEPIVDSRQPEHLVQEVSRPNGAVTLNLSKGISLDLSKQAPTLKKATIGLGWDTAQGKNIDLDVFALLLHDGKIKDESDVIFFHQQNTGKGVTLSDDNRTGEGEGDDESIYLDFNNIPSNINTISVFVNIYNPGDSNFGMVKNAYVRLINSETDKEECIYLLNEDGAFYQTFHFANLVRNSSGWSFETVGQGTSGSIQDIVNRYC